MIEASVVTEGDERGFLGRFGFVQLPAPGDRLTASHMSGWVEAVFVVLRVEHAPVKLPVGPTSRSDPTAVVVVEHLHDLTD